MNELREIQIDGTTYKIKELSDYRLLKITESHNSSADLFKELILATVVEPKLTKEEVEDWKDGRFYKLGMAIVKLHEDRFKKLNPKELDEFLKNLNPK